MVLSEQSSDSDLQERLQVVVRLTELFKFERYVYLGVTLTSLVVLLISGISMIFKDDSSAAVLTLLFGSSGLITYSTGRLLRMWNEALRTVIPGQSTGSGDA